MGCLCCNCREIILYYDSTSSLGKKTLAYAKSCGCAVLEIDITKTHFTGTQLIELAKGLKMNIGDLVDKCEWKLKFHLDFGEFSQEDWVKILLANPGLLRQPIARRGKRMVLIHTPSDIFRLEHENHYSGLKPLAA